MVTPSPALGLGALEFAGFQFLASIWSASPRREILWQAQDAQGNLETDKNGQAVFKSLMPQVVVQERHNDEMRMTEHPIEVGAAITDHAFKLPSVVEIRGGWSFAAAGGGPSPLPVATDASYLQQLYGTLLTIQAQRAFVTLVTGKRTYSNLLLRRLAVQTDEKTENVLDFQAEFRQVLIARTQVVSVPDPSVMKNPQSNAAPTNLGQTSLLTGSKINATSANGLLPESMQIA